MPLLLDSSQNLALSLDSGPESNTLPSGRVDTAPRPENFLTPSGNGRFTSKSQTNILDLAFEEMWIFGSKAAQIWLLRSTAALNHLPPGRVDTAPRPEDFRKWTCIMKKSGSHSRPCLSNVALWLGSGQNVALSPDSGPNIALSLDSGPEPCTLSPGRLDPVPKSFT